MRGILDQVHFNDTLLDYFIAASIIAIGTLMIRVIKGTLLRGISSWAKRTKTPFDDLILNSIDRFGFPALYFLVIYMGLKILQLPLRGQHILNIAVIVVITYFIIRLISSVLHLLLRSYVGRQEKGEKNVKQLGGLMLIINMVIWVIGALFLFDNMGYDITAVVAGLGIGGIAVALAAQNILGDLFNYFVIFFDRPFEIGDFIVVDQKSGTVEYIGIKTTRVRALSGEQLVFPNSDLTGSRLHNYKRMQTRRIAFKFGVVQETPLDRLREIPLFVRSIVEQQRETVFDRAHFASYGDSSLDFEVVYTLRSADYNIYMDVQQAINLAILQEFQERNIALKDPNRMIAMMDRSDGKEEKIPNDLSG